LDYATPDEIYAQAFIPNHTSQVALSA